MMVGHGLERDAVLLAQNLKRFLPASGSSVDLADCRPPPGLRRQEVRTVILISDVLEQIRIRRAFRRQAEGGNRPELKRSCREIFARNQAMRLRMFKMQHRVLEPEPVPVLGRRPDIFLGHQIGRLFEQPRSRQVKGVLPGMIVQTQYERWGGSRSSRFDEDRVSSRAKDHGNEDELPRQILPPRCRFEIAKTTPLSN